MYMSNIFEYNGFFIYKSYCYRLLQIKKIDYKEISSFFLFVTDNT